MPDALPLAVAVSATLPVTLADAVPEKDSVGDSEPLAEPLAVALSDSEPDTLADAAAVPDALPLAVAVSATLEESVGDSEPLAVTLGDGTALGDAEAVSLADADKDDETLAVRDADEDEGAMYVAAVIKQIVRITLLLYCAMYALLLLSRATPVGSKKVAAEFAPSAMPDCVPPLPPATVLTVPVSVSMARMT